MIPTKMIPTMKKTPQIVMDYVMFQKDKTTLYNTK